MKTRNFLYITIIAVWILLIIITYNLLIEPLTKTNSIVEFILVLLSTIFLIYFYLNGVKDFIYPFWYRLFCKNNLITIKNVVDSNIKIDLIYCTYNDFNSKSLSTSINNTDLIKYNSTVYILDDSTDVKYINNINDFASKYPFCKVIRRKDRIGFKAGNINNWFFNLKDKNKPDYFIILDSDEIIPTNFIPQTLGLAEKDKSIGVVQANHKVNEDSITNTFIQTYEKGVESHWKAYQKVKDMYGFLSLLGHGALVRTEAYQKVNGFPNVVAEDLCFSINLREKGYYVKFASNVMCYEEYPIDYFAFKKRHIKWTQGNMEFIKKYTSVIINSPMKWYEKLDIFLFTYNLPLSATFSLYLIINIILLPLLNFDLNYNILLLIPTILMLIAPLLNDIFYWWTKYNFKIINYSIMAILLYGSMLFCSVIVSLKSTFGTSTFIVTPKSSSNISIFNSIKLNIGEITFALLLLIISYTINKSILPVLLIVIPSISSIYLGLMSNKSIQ